MAEEDQFIRPTQATPVGTPEFQAFALADQEKKQKAEMPEVSFSDFIGASKEEDWMTSYIFQGNEEFAPDENYLREGLDEELFNELTADIPEDYHDFLEETVSEAHARQMREKVLKSVENEKKMQSWGWSGVPLRLGVNMADPGAIGVTVMTEGIAAPLIWGNKLSRVDKEM